MTRAKCFKKSVSVTLAVAHTVDWHFCNITHERRRKSNTCTGNESLHHKLHADPAEEIRRVDENYAIL